MPAAPLHDTTRDLGWALGTLLRAYLKAMGDVVAEIPGGPRAFQVLEVAVEGTCRNQSAIAEMLSIDRTMMTYLIDDLEKQELVERKPDPADRRSRQILITAKGLKLYRELRVQVDKVERNVFGSLSDSEVTALRSLLGRAAQDADGNNTPTHACEIVEDLSTTL